jgi:nuclease HARBI1
MDIVARWPGSAYDQAIFNNSVIRARLEMGEFGDGVILGDSGYAVKSYLLTPLRNPVRREEILYNESQIRTRGAVERQYGVWKRRFPVLSLGIRLRLDRVQNVIVACAVLHNLAIEMNEPEPPVDPELPVLDLEQDQIPRPEAIGAGQYGTLRGLVEYFRTL